MISAGPAVAPVGRLRAAARCHLRGSRRRRHVGRASRLARNGRDWNTLLEFCGLVGTVIIDEDGVYDPAMLGPTNLRTRPDMIRTKKTLI
jgi:hypothetical protein